MSLTEYLAWRTNSLHFYTRLTQHSELEVVQQTRHTMIDELAITERIAHQHMHPEAMDAVTRIWWQWIQDVLPTYQNNPRIFEAENTARRQAATAARNAALAALKKGQAA